MEKSIYFYSTIVYFGMKTAALQRWKYRMKTFKRFTVRFSHNKRQTLFLATLPAIRVREIIRITQICTEDWSAITSRLFFKGRRTPLRGRIEVAELRCVGRRAFWIEGVLFFSRPLNYSGGTSGSDRPWRKRRDEWDEQGALEGPIRPSSSRGHK